MILVKYPKVRFKIPADLLFLLNLKVSLIWHAYLILVTLIANSKLEFLPQRLLCNFSRIPQIMVEILTVSSLMFVN